VASKELAYFGCGCFWTKEFLFGKLPGVVATQTGYMGGSSAQPTYHKVCTKTTGHAEVVEVTYDSEKTSLEQLLKGFFAFHDATKDRSGNGGQYRSVVFWRKQEERTFLETTFSALRENGFLISTSIEKVDTFWEAEERHQGYVVRTGRHCDLASTMNLEVLSIPEILKSKVS